VFAIFDAKIGKVIYRYRNRCFMQRDMGKQKGMLSNIQKRVDGFFYKCEYIKECDKITPQCAEGGNSYCGEYNRRNRSK
jgi:hypothetical protein